MNDKMIVLPGERCRKAREELGWTTAEAAKRMHLSQTYLLALEADDYERLPEATFVKGYLKNYARLLGLPADEVANTFQQMLNEDAFDKPLDLPSMPRKPGLLGRPLGWVLMLVLVGVAAVVFWPKGGIAPQSEDAAPVENIPDAAEQQDTAPDMEPALQEQTGAEDAGSAMASTEPLSDDRLAGAETADAVAGAEPAVEEEPAVAPDMLAANGLDRLVLELSADCWMEIRDANGRVLRQGVKPADATLRVDGKAPFDVKIGDAAAVSGLFLNGEAVTLPTDSPGRVVKLTLP